MLTGSGLGDDALLPHPFGEPDLPEAVVDLVAARVIEVFALEVVPSRRRDVSSALSAK